MAIAAKKKKGPRSKSKASKKTGRKKTASTSEVLKRTRESNRKRSQDYRTRHSQDIGVHYFAEIARGPVDKARRIKASKSLEFFCKTYFPKWFDLEWASYHKVLISKLEGVILEGKLFAFAVPRGGGKTRLCIAAILWAALNGHCRYPLLILATAAAAARRLAGIKKTLRTNAILAADYPEIIYPIRHLRNEAAKARGQKFFDEPSEIEWKNDKVVFAELDLSKLPSRRPDDIKKSIWTPRSKILQKYKGLNLGFGAILDITSMESGDIRGRSHTRADGDEVRPDVAIVDDPQTRRSAKSLGMVEEREAILFGDIQYCGGPGKSIGVAVPLTVIFEGDLACRILDPKLHPEFRPERSKMVESFPKSWETSVCNPASPDDTESIRLWRRYREMFVRDLETDGDLATRFYADNRKAMDEGFSVTWEARFDEDEISAIQHAVNLFFKDQGAFYAEAQNDPAAANEEAVTRRMTVDDFFERRNKIKRRVIPDWADCLVADIDVQGNSLWWKVLAVRKSDFTSAIVDFGVSPDQGTGYYRLATLRKTLQRHYPGELFETALEKALDALVKKLANRIDWISEDDRILSLDAIGVDSGWGEYTNLIYRFCRRHELRSILHATKGVGVGPSDRPLVDPEAKRKGLESVLGQWRVTRTKLRTPLLQYDTNFWKTKLSNFLRVTPGAPSSMTVFQTDEGKLRVLAENLTSEIATQVKTKRRTSDQWKVIPGRDNHHLDNGVGCLVLAHKLGARLPTDRTKPKKTKESKETAKSRATGTRKRTGGRRGRRGINATF